MASGFVSSGSFVEAWSLGLSGFVEAWPSSLLVRFSEGGVAGVPLNTNEEAWLLCVSFSETDVTCAFSSSEEAWLLCLSFERGRGNA